MATQADASAESQTATARSSRGSRANASVRYHATDSRVEHSLLQAVARTHADALIEVVGPERANPPALIGGQTTEKEIN